MHGERRPVRPANAVAAPDVGGELRVCINIPSLNRAASQDLFWPSHVGRSGGYPFNYVSMPFGLLNMGALYQRLAQRTMASHEARRSAAALSSMSPSPNRISPGITRSGGGR